MSETPTPRTDDAWDAYNRDACGLRYIANKMRELERELVFANERIRRLEAAGDAMAKDFSHFWTDRQSVRDWPKVREASQ